MIRIYPFYLVELRIDDLRHLLFPLSIMQFNYNIRNLFHSAIHPLKNPELGPLNIYLHKVNVEIWANIEIHKTVKSLGFYSHAIVLMSCHIDLWRRFWTIMKHRFNRISRAITSGPVTIQVESGLSIILAQGGLHSDYLIAQSSVGSQEFHCIW